MSVAGPTARWPAARVALGRSLPRETPMTLPRSMLLALLLALAPGGAPAARAQDPQADLVRSWYQHFLNREPDPQGFAIFLGRLRRGDSPLDLQAEFLGSDEFFNNRGRDPAALVAGFHQTVLGTNPRPEDVATWVRRLDRERGNRVNLARAFLRATAGQAPPPPPGPPTNLAGIADALAGVSRQFLDFVSREVGGTLAGRRLLLRGRALVESADNFQGVMRQFGLRPAAQRAALDNVGRALQEVQNEL